VAAGLLSEVHDGYFITSGFIKIVPKEKVEHWKEENKKRQQAWRDRQRNGVTNGVTNTVTNGRPSPSPSPSPSDHNNEVTSGLVHTVSSTTHPPRSTTTATTTEPESGQRHSTWTVDNHGDTCTCEDCSARWVKDIKDDDVPF
jgi:hypothetical protein